ncbi:hypothetical protein LPJ79_003071 [Coemansia sp. RSA 1821]|nr:hypothetical protein LPJ68_002309 [Coemansia sp. RSA 1086]KAJ1750236.1 hypothetical protein LPJ79_003071 [Coemansia sp. RSA 1821]
MDLAASVAQLPGVALHEPVCGGLAFKQTTTYNADVCLLFRFTAHLLEVRNLAIPSLESAEALATLSTSQLYANTVEDLEISLVQPVVLNDTQHLLVFARETLSETGRLYAFNPFTLNVCRVAARVPYHVYSLCLSNAILAGQGSSTEWEFAVVCFGLGAGRIMLGNLNISFDGSQLTAMKKFNVDEKHGKVLCAHAAERPDSEGRVLVVLGMESGSIAVLEYEPFAGGRITLVHTSADAAQLGPISRVTLACVDKKNLLLCAGHQTGVALHSVKLGTAIHVEFVTAQQIYSDNATEDVNVVDLHVLDASDEQTTTIAMLSTTGSVGKVEQRGRARVNGRRSTATTLPSDSSTFVAWEFDKQSASLKEVVRQDAADVALGMHISGRAQQVEVVTPWKLLLGATLAPQPALDLETDELAWLNASNAFVYAASVRQATLARRKRMDGELFIDLLLHMAGTRRSAYPPRTAADQRALVARVTDSDLDPMKQQCILYYLALDTGSSALVVDKEYVEQDTDASQNEVADQYVQDVRLPRHFTYLMRGYWLMDHAQVAAGIPYLADPSVVADWAFKILDCAAAEHPAAALVFLDSATALLPPRLGSQPTEAPLVMSVLLRSDLNRAFSFQRQYATQPELRQALLAQLFEFALSANSRRSIADRLATLPFDGVEEHALAAHCLNEGAAAYARDFLALHYVNCGRYAEAIRLFRAADMQTEGTEALDAMQRKKRDERRAMVRSLTMLLPDAQRDAVEELDAEPQQSLTSKAAPISVPSVPLSATKSVRLNSRAVGVRGTPSHPLLRVLMRQMAVERHAMEEDASKANVPSTPEPASRTAGGTNQATTPWKTPMTSLPLTDALRVPLSGYPSTPRQMSPASRLANAGRTPAHGLLSQNMIDDSADSKSAKEVPGSFPEPPVTRSPFAKAKQQSDKAKQAQSSAGSATPQRYNLRARTGMTPLKPTKEASATNGQSARTLERAVRGHNSKQGSRTRKRE